MSMFIINPYVFSGPTNDPYYNSTNLLVHLDSSTSSILIDDSFYNSDISMSTGGSIDTAQKKFGAGCLFCNSASVPALASPGSSPYTRFDLNITDWTWELFMFDFSTGSLGSLVSHRVGGADGWAWTSTSLRAVINGAWGDPQMSWTHPGYDAWHHMVLQKTGTDLAVYADGVRVATKSGVTSIQNVGASANVIFGASSNSGENKLYGRLDEIRFTRGVARYSGASFTPPTAAFPNF